MILSLTISVIVGLQSSKTIPVEAINSIQTEPIAPLGGVLMVQLVSETLGDNWPSTIDVTFEVIEGPRAFVERIDITGN